MTNIFDTSHWEKANYGATRRELILEQLKLLKDNNQEGLPVNKKNWPSTKKDKDIVRLLKQGKIELVRFKSNRLWCLPYHRESYIRIV